MTPELIAAIKRTRVVVFDFDGVFTDNTVIVAQDGAESVVCWRGDGLGLRKLEQLGLRLLILSTEVNPVVSARARKLAIACRQGVADKGAALVEVAGEAGCTLAEIAYLGNDINDRGCLERAGLPMVVADAHEDVVGLALYRTRTPGGRGAVREICDLFEEVLR